MPWLCAASWTNFGYKCNFGYINSLTNNIIREYLLLCISPPTKLLVNVIQIDITVSFFPVLWNTNRTVLVAQTKDDANNYIGTMCGSYFGPQINSSPLKLEIQCTQPTYGKFLRITYEGYGDMLTCEVVVHTPWY